MCLYAHFSIGISISVSGHKYPGAVGGFDQSLQAGQVAMETHRRPDGGGSHSEHDSASAGH